MTTEVVVQERTRVQITDEVRGKVRKALARLGTTAITTVDEVAQTLLNEECRGYMRESLICPVSTYLNRHVITEDELIFRVTDTHVSVEITPSGMHAFWVCIDFPEPIMQFVRMFDAGEYPELDMNRYLESFAGSVEPPVIVVDPDPLTSELEAVTA